ncbi:DUF6159 family protein [Roseibium sp. SCP14]|uniref:DUF6159 family protein n=1 Tax=Roseibium sp. SCP14 TaxID=3141375 RepID=UPI00333AF540
MFEKIERAFTYAAASWKVLMLDKEMLLFPIMSGAALAGIFASGAWVVYSSPTLQGLFQAMLEQTQSDQSPVLWALVFVLFFVSYFIMIFFNAGLLSCALIRFGGGNPTIKDGLRSALRRLPQILVWAFVTATVGWLLQILESRMRGVGKVFVDLLGAGWAVATYFVVPILVVDGTGPVAAVKRSVVAIRKTWGEALVGYVGLGILNLGASLLALPLLFWGVSEFDDNPALGGGLLASGAAIMLVSALFVTTLSAILRAALFIYARDGQVPDCFEGKLIRSAFRPEEI